MEYILSSTRLGGDTVDKKSDNFWYLVSRVDQIKYDLEELPVHGELVNRLHMSKVPYRKRREEGITGPLEVVLCQY